MGLSLHHLGFTQSTASFSRCSLCQSCVLVVSLVRLCLALPGPVRSSHVSVSGSGGGELEEAPWAETSLQMHTRFHTCFPDTQVPVSKAGQTANRLLSCFALRSWMPEFSPSCLRRLRG